MFAVASSITTTRFFSKMALQMHINCFSPELKFLPPSVIFIFKPRSDSGFETVRSSISFNPAKTSNDSILSSETVLKGSRLKRREPINKVGSCGITVTFCRSVNKSISRMSIPSISIDPSSISTSRLTLRQIVDLPAPVLPTMPTLVPG